MPPRRSNKDSWQTDPHRVAVNRTAPGGDQNSPEYAEKEAAAYHDHPKNSSGKNICAAKKGNGSLCQKLAGTGTEHRGFGKCSQHGGNTPTLRTNGARYIGNEVIDRMSMGGYGRAVELSPTDALLQEVGRAAGHVAFIGQRIEQFEVEEGGFFTGEQQQWIDLYQAERMNLVKVAKVALDAGVDERKIRLKEQEAGNIVALLKQVFGALHLTVDQQRLVQTVVPAALREFAEPTRFIESERVDTT